MTCSLCPNKNRCIPPSGPMRQGDIMFIGEAPGYDEDRRGTPFIGKTGAEFDNYLTLAGQNRSTSYVTNSIRCLPDRPKGQLDMGRQADKDLLLACAQEHLYEEIAEMQPSLLVPMGAFACYAIDPNIDLTLHHGMPVETALGITAFPKWHPAGGLHEPKRMLYIRTDWIRLGEYLNGQYRQPVDPYTDPDYREVEDPDEILELDPTIPMANDTETSKLLGPFCLTYSQYPGTGRLIRADRKDLLTVFQSRLDEWESDIWFHNYPYDAKVVRDMGLRYPKIIRDTMLRTFNLGNIEQGLKVAAFRQLGVKMLDFEDLVKPYSRPRVIDYYRLAKYEDWPKPEPEMLRGDDGMWKVKQPHSMKTKLKTFFTNLEKNPDKDVFKMWDNWEAQHEMLEAVLGPWPGMDIAHAAQDNWPAVLVYACRDADVTLRYKDLIEEMVAKVKTGLPQERWR